MRSKGLFLLMGVLITVFFLAGTSANVYADTVLLEDNFNTENGGLNAINYTNFTNWNVIDGAVDLGNYTDFGLPPAYQVFVDLDGSGAKAGTMESKVTFSLAPGYYELKFDLAGSQRNIPGRNGPNNVVVSLGSEFTETFTLAWDEPFRTITRILTVTSPTSGTIKFQHDGADWVGLLLDNVRLTQLDSAPLYNVVLSANVTLHGEFFTGGFPPGYEVDKQTIVDGVFLPQSNPWDQGSVWWDAHLPAAENNYITIDLGGLFAIESFVAQVDDNDAYFIDYWDLGMNTWVSVWHVPNYNAGYWGMTTRPNPADSSERYVLSSIIITDTLRFRGDSSNGDKYFSVSEMQAYGEPVIVSTIDIKPGGYPNCFNINGNGVIPVAILGSADFDINQIDVSTLNFGGLDVRVKGNGNPQCSVKDVSGDFTSPEGMPDGWSDLVCQFVDDPLAWYPDDGTATLNGNLIDGSPIMGSDEICLRPE